MFGPDKNKLYPNENIKTVCYIRNLPKRPNVEIGEYTYYSDNNKSPERFYDNIEHHYEFLGDKLIIGKFCAIAEGVKFIMNGANHKMDGITTYPFNVFGNGWEKVTPTIDQLPFKGDTVIGNDVWIGQNVTIMPGVKVGDGAIIATNSTVVKNVEPYTIYGGNPAKFIKKRFSDEEIELLLKLQWWNWDEEKIFNNLEKLTSKAGLDELMDKVIKEDFMNKKEIVTKENLIIVLDLLDSMEMRYWIDGGWGIDILLGQQNREHRDIDVDFDGEFTKALLDKLKEKGYEIVVDWSPSRIELYHPELGYIDIHPLIINKDGSARQADPQGGWYEFEAKWFSTAVFEGRVIPCISAEAQKLFHSGYELREVDKMDMKNLDNLISK